MSNLLGLQSDVALTTYFIYPSEDDSESCDELAIYGSHGLRRLRPELPILVGGRVLFGDRSGDLSKAHAVLHGGELDRSGFSVALKEYCTEPFPDIRVIEAGSRLLYTLPGDGGGESQEVSMIFASIDRSASARFRRGDRPTESQTFLPRNPAKDMLLDVFVHRDIWSGSEPHLEIGRGANLLSAPAIEGVEIDRLDLRESIQFLGTDPAAIPFKPLPRYTEMLAQVIDRAGLEAEQFRLYRLHVKYPVISLSYSVVFPLANRPVKPFYDSTGSR
jgi:hypothetical protein